MADDLRERAFRPSRPELRGDPFADFPNPKAARAASGVNLFGKLLGLVGIDESGERGRTDWGAALRNTITAPSLSNAAYDFMHNADVAVKTGDPLATFAAASAVPVVNTAFSAIPGTLPGGSFLASNAPGRMSHGALGALDELGFYSTVGRALEKVKIKSGTPDQIINALKNAGAKPEEIKWSGVREFLDERVRASGKDKVDVDTVRNYMDEARIEPRKRTDDERGDDDMSDIEERVRDRMYDDVENDFEIKIDEDLIDRLEQDYLDRWDVAEDPDRPGVWNIIDTEEDPDYNMVSDGYTSEDAARQSLVGMAREHAEETAPDMDRPWAIYRDGEKYDDGFRTEDHARDRSYEFVSDSVYDSVSNMTREEMYDYLGETMPADGGRHYSYLEDTLPESADAYREDLYSVDQDVLNRVGWKGSSSNHWDEPNLIGSLIKGDVKGGNASEPMGLNGLMLHEVQSDWGQRGRKRGQDNWGIRGAERQKAIDDYRRLSDKLEAFTTGWNVIGPGGTYDYLARPGVYRGGPSIQELMRLRADAKSHALALEQYRENMQADPSAEWARKAYEEEVRNVAYYQGMLRDAQRSMEYMPPDEAQAWLTQRDALNAQKDEAEKLYDRAMYGVSEGPWVTNTSDWTKFLLKNALTEAAHDNYDFLAWTSPDLIEQRWRGQNLGEFYGKTIPNIMSKLVREHDKSAKVEPFGVGTLSPYAKFVDEPIMSTPEAPMLFDDLRLDSAPAFITSSRDHLPTGVEMVPRHASGADMHGSYTEHIGAGSDVRPMYRLVRDDGTPTAGIFRSSEAAANALRALRESKGNTIDDYSEKYLGVRMTPALRDSIKTRGWSLFANPPSAAIPGIVVNQPEKVDNPISDEFWRAYAAGEAT